MPADHRAARTRNGTRVQCIARPLNRTTGRGPALGPGRRLTFTGWPSFHSQSTIQPPRAQRPLNEPCFAHSCGRAGSRSIPPRCDCMSISAIPATAGLVAASERTPRPDGVFVQHEAVALHAAERHRAEASVPKRHRLEPVPGRLAVGQRERLRLRAPRRHHADNGRKNPTHPYFSSLIPVRHPPSCGFP